MLVQIHMMRTIHIEEKVKEVMVPYIESYDFSEYLPKLDSVLTEIVNSDFCIGNKKVLENFKNLMIEPEQKEIKLTDLFKAWIKQCERDIDTDDLDIDYDDNLTNKVLKEICRISDAHNIDRDSTLKYFADMLTAFTEVATIQNYDSKQTNADRIRNMTDEELAVNMMCPNENGLAEIDCDKNDNCNCYECLLKWLRAESEE